jgi:hypothetical protein
MARAAGLAARKEGWGIPRSRGQPHVAQGISQPDAARRQDRPRDAADALIQRPRNEYKGIPRAIHYYISLDAVAAIRGIYFAGLQAFSADTLRGWMDTKVYDFFGVGGFVQVRRVVSDLEAIRERYRAAGYLQFRYDCDREGAWGEGAIGSDEGGQGLVRSLRRRGEWLFARHRVEDLCFTVLREADEGTVYLFVPVVEGPQSVIAGVEFEGLREVKLREARAVFGLAAGAPFSPVRVLEAAERLRRLLRSRGYYPARVEVACAPEGAGEFVMGCPGGEAYGARPRVRVLAYEGRRRVVGERFVRGGFDTADGLILRDLPPKGAPYDEDAILAGVRKLRNLGVFDSLRVSPVGLEEEPAATEIGLVVDLEEGQSRFVDLSVGFETLHRDEERMPFWVSRTLSDAVASSDQRGAGYGDGTLLRLPDLLIVFEVAYVHRHFLEWAKELHLPLRYGLSTTSLNRLASFRPTYIDSRFLATDLRFRLTPFILYDRATRVLDQFSYGAELEFALPNATVAQNHCRSSHARLETRSVSR